MQFISGRSSYEEINKTKIRFLMTNIVLAGDNLPIQLINLLHLETFICCSSRRKISSRSYDFCN